MRGGGRPGLRDDPAADRWRKTLGDPILEGDEVVGSRWRRRWKRRRRKLQAAFYAGIVVAPTTLWAAGVQDGAVWVACDALLVAAFTYAHASAGARMFMRPIEVYESGVVATRKARWVAPRRFVTWAEIAEARAETWGAYGEHLVLPLRGGGSLHTIPGELDAAGTSLMHQRLQDAKAVQQGAVPNARA